MNKKLLILLSASIVCLFGWMIFQHRINTHLPKDNVFTKKKTEEELRKAKNLAEDALEVKQNFLANMSHEIRTPMNGILGITRVLQKTEMNDEQKHYLNAIIKSSENLMVIINDILDFSKIDAGKIVIEKRNHLSWKKLPIRAYKSLSHEDFKPPQYARALHDRLRVFSNPPCHR